MAKPKVKFLVKVESDQIIKAYCDEPVWFIEEVKGMEGVKMAFIDLAPLDWVNIFIDPRYDVAEVAKEIEELLQKGVGDG